jgi:hypothetical protein
MQLESLLLSRDPEVIRVVQPALEKLAIDVEQIGCDDMQSTEFGNSKRGAGSLATAQQICA